MSLSKGLAVTLTPSPTASEFRSLQRDTSRCAAAITRAVAQSSDRYSLSSLVLSMLPEAHIPDRAGLEAAHAVAHTVRQLPGGSTNNGAWVPFAALARDLTTANASPLVANNGRHNELAASLAPVPSILGAGCTILTGLNYGQLNLPVLSSGVSPAGAWLAENSVAQQREPTFAVRALVPKTLSVELIISRRLLQQSGLAIEQELRKELLKRVLNEIDAAILMGDGNLQPLGLLNDPDVEVLSSGINGAAPSWEHVCALEYAVGARHGQMAAPAFLMHPALRQKMRTTPRASGQDFLMSGDQLLQKPVNVSAMLPTNLTKGTATGLTPLIFGDLSEIVVGFWGPAAVDLMVDPMSRSTTGAIRLIARVEVGSVVRYTGAVSVYKDLSTV